MNHIDAAQNHSVDILKKLRELLKTEDNTFAIVVGGSVARLEASPESDLDYFFFGDDDDAIKRAKEHLQKYAESIKSIVGKEPSVTGAFGSENGETLDALNANIGGNDDANGKITRRILFLLEGAWLSSEKTVERYRREVLKRYISTAITDPQLCRFLLNDIIRYYRTICVDFEFKTVEGGKEWGLRYIKLRYSRQLLYFSGLIAVAETVNMSRDEKIERLAALMQLPPIQRIREVVGEQNVAPALKLYNEFLGGISNGVSRAEINEVTQDRNTHTEIFKKLREDGRVFSQLLAEILQNKYDANHLIHRAIIF